MSAWKLSACLTILLLHQSIAAQTPAKPAPVGTATVTGRVTVKGEPARGVTVFLQSQPGPGAPPPSGGSASGWPSAKTDEAGRFRFTSVVAGRHTIMAAAPGYVSADDSQFGPRGKMLNVADGENVENVNIALQRGGVITGRITNSQGQPVVEERVTLSKLDRAGKPQEGFSFGGGSFEMYLTDDRGIYRIYGLPAGRYLASVGYVRREGSVSVGVGRIFYPRTYHSDVADATDESQAKVLEVADGSESTGVDIRVAEPKKTYDVYGRVVNADTGQPVAGLEIWRGSIYPSGGMGGSGSSGERSGPNGEFHLTGVLPGRYGIFVRRSPDSDFYSEPTECEVGDGDLQGIEVKVHQGSTISGVVVVEGTSDPAVLARLKLIQLSYNVSGSNTAGPIMMPRGGGGNVNADGSFRIRGVQPGKVRISMVPMGDLQGLRLSRIELNGAPVDRDGIVVVAGEQVTGVRVVFSYGTLVLRGEVKIAGGALPPGQRLVILAKRSDQPAQNPMSSAEVDARWQFAIEYLSPGEYELTLSPIFLPDRERLDPQVAQAIRSFSQRVVVSGANQSPVTVLVDLNRKEGDK